MEVLKLERAIRENNDQEALLKLAALLLIDDLNTKDVPRALQLLERAIVQHENPSAMYHLAIHFRAHGNTSQKRRVVPLLERAVHSSSDPQLFFTLASVVYDGDTGGKDVHRAVQLLERAVKLGKRAPHMVRLAEILLCDSAVRGDMKRALRLYKRAISISNNGWQMYRLGFLFAHGTFSLQKCTKCAIKWYERAIQVENLVQAKVDLARALTDSNSRQYQDPVRAVKLLEEALLQEYSTESVMELGKVYSSFQKILSGPPSRLPLRALKFMLAFYLLGDPKVQPDHNSAFLLCKLQYEVTNDSYTLYVMVCLLWSGSQGVSQNRKLAYSLCKNDEQRDVHAAHSSLLRYGAEHVVAPNQLLAKELSGRFGVTTCNGLLQHAIILSESDSEKDRDRAEDLFIEIWLNGSRFYGWVPLTLRRSSLNFPFDGKEACCMSYMRRMTMCSELAAFNLATLFLEQDERTKDGLKILTCMGKHAREESERVMAMLCEAYVLWEGIGTIDQDRRQVFAILHRAIDENKDVCANAMLVNAVMEIEDAEDADRELALAIWQGLKGDCEDDSDFHKLRRLLSHGTREALGLNANAARCKAQKSIR
ncbi:unnamed protein product [Agarophyton chilense]